MVGFLNKYIPDIAQSTDSPSQIRTQAVLNSLDEGVVLTGQNDEIIYINRKARTLFGLQNWDHQGQGIRELLQHIENHNSPTNTDKLNQITAQVVGTSSLIADNFIVQFNTPILLYIRYYTAPIHDDRQGYLGRIWKFTDQTGIVTLDKAKTDFISIASHQLRTPMTSISGYLDMTLSGDFGTVPANLQEPLQAIRIAGERMKELINELLNTSRLENGKTAINLQTFDLTKLIQAELQAQSVNASQKQMQLHVNNLLVNQIITADSNLVREAFKNYLSNAIKYGNTQSEVQINIDSQGEQVRVSVTDQGIGIPPQATPHVFSKMYRADNAINGNFEGTGLGLCYVKQVIEMLGGQVGFTSQLGSGSTFWFTIPRLVTKIQQS